MNSYDQFIESKSQSGINSGFEPVYLPDFLFDFQKSLVEWAIRKGRAAIFADCGLGKTPMQLVWAENVTRKTGKPTLIITPLAVAAQHIREGEKFGIECHRSSDGTLKPNITITNYEQLHKFNPEDFGGAVCDESSILKSFKGVHKQEITVFMRKMNYRLLATATAAPNDYVELGTSSEALGYMGHMDMLGKFFKNDQNTNAAGGGGHGIGGKRFGDQTKWRFKGHAELPFWKWVCSWARAVRKPSDLGFDDSKFVLPPLYERQHLVNVKNLADGMLFALPAHGLQEQRDERRRSINERCEKVAELVNGHKPALVWCHLNPEGDLLEKLIPGAVQVSGDDSDEWKVAAVEWFCGYTCRCQLTKLKVKTKLSTCKQQNGGATTGNDGIENTERSGLQERSNMHSDIVQSEKNISPIITEQTSSNTNLKSLKKSKKTRSKKEDTEATLFIGTALSSPQSCGGLQTQERSSVKELRNTESQQTTLIESQKTNAESVQSAEQINQTRGEEGCTSTIAIQPEKSEVCFAQIAIKDSGSSKTKSGESKERCSICGGEIEPNRKLISKPKILAFGMNLQHCSHVTFFPSHSYEQYYQGIRRCWRFGQKNPVTVDVVTTEGELNVLRNLQRKAGQADRMFSNLVAEMNNAFHIEKTAVNTTKEKIPSWLKIK